MSKNRVRHSFVRTTLTAAALAAACAIAGPAVASAQPSTGSAEDVLNSGSAILDSGSAILDGGSILDGGRAILNSGSSILNTIPGSGSFAPTQQCNETTKAGGAGVTQTNHQLGKAGPTSFVLNYETENIPDLIEVFYEGGLVYSTGYVGDNENEGTGAAVVYLPPGGSTSVLVKVTGPANTEWSYAVSCPIS